MLRFTATDDKNLLNSLNNQIFNEDFEGGVGYVLYDGDEAIGVAKMTVSTTVSTLERVGIVESARKKGNGDFFTRSLIWGMSNVCDTVVVNGVSTYFTKFGFVTDGDKMTCQSNRVVFPCGCHK